MSHVDVRTAELAYSTKDNIVTDVSSEATVAQQNDHATGVEERASAHDVALQPQLPSTIETVDADSATTTRVVRPRLT